MNMKEMEFMKKETECVFTIQLILQVLWCMVALQSVQMFLFLHLFNYNSGTARGCGWQKIGAFVNLGSYYLVGIPAAVVLAFVLHIGGKV